MDEVREDIIYHFGEYSPTFFACVPHKARPLFMNGQVICDTISYACIWMACCQSFINNGRSIRPSIIYEWTSRIQHPRTYHYPSD